VRKENGEKSETVSSGLPAGRTGEKIRKGTDVGLTRYRCRGQDQKRRGGRELNKEDGQGFFAPTFKMLWQRVAGGGGGRNLFTGGCAWKEGTVDTRRSRGIARIRREKGYGVKEGAGVRY